MATYNPIFRSPIFKSSTPNPLREPSTLNIQPQTSNFHLSDLSGVQVTLIQGEVGEVLQQYFAAVPARPGDLVDVDGGVLACLTPREFYLFGLSPLAPLPAVATLEKAFTKNQRLAHAADYTHGKAVLRLAGIPAAQLLSKICGLDFYNTVFPNLHVAQTSAAKIKTLIVRHDENNTPTYTLHVNRPLGQYFWQVVWEAGQEYELSVLPH